MSTLSVKDTIQNRLLLHLGRQWQVGDRLPPIRELARELGAGQSNTHEAVRQLVAEGVLKSRQRAGTYVVRIPDMQRLAGMGADLTGRKLAVVTFLPHSDSFVDLMTDAFVEEVTGTNATVHRIEINPEQDINADWPGDVDAVALFNPSSSLDLSRYASRQILAVASTSWSVISALPDGVDAVGVNDYQGAMLAGQRIAKASADEVGFIGVTCDGLLTTTRLEHLTSVRLSGFEAGWGRRMHSEHIIPAHGYSIFSGGKAFGKYMRMNPRPRILFAASDDLALGVAAAASASGLRAGDDFHLIGFDGQHRGRYLVDGSLTTVVVPEAQMGKRLAQLIRDRLINPQRPVHRLQLDCTFNPGCTLTFKP